MMIAPDNPWLISLGGGTIAAVVFSFGLHKSIEGYAIREGKKPAKRLVWMPILMGVIERAMYTTLVGNEISGAASFIGAWVTIKAVGGWANWSKDGSLYGRALFSTALMSSAVSALFGIWGGLLLLESLKR